MSVDWRNRFGRNYVTTATDQGRTNFCWGFATTALVEAMVRIEHNVWCVRSEGDLMKGLDWFAFQGGWHDPHALDFLVNNGLADHDCFPFSDVDAPYVHPYSASAGSCGEDGAASHARPSRRRRGSEAVARERRAARGRVRSVRGL